MILVVEEELSELRSYFDVALRCLGYGVEFVDERRQALNAVRKNIGRYALVLLDTSPQVSAELLRQFSLSERELPVISFVESYARNHEEDLRSNGAACVLVKPIEHDQLRSAVQRHSRIQAIASEGVAMNRIGLGPGSWSKRMESFLEHVGSSDVPVLLQGETGVGKEVLARHLHNLSPRSKKPLLKVNCAALPSELIESELFGYDRGAFTGAFKNTPGKFELANGGTILLDEIGDMDFKLQAKLLQVLQDHEFLRLGASEPCRVDVRVMAATHCDLEKMIDERRFREDLYYRLNIIAIEVPPLRERRDEILTLACHFVEKHAAPGEPLVEIPPALQDALLHHDWPGNIRELENVMRKLLVLRRPERIIEDLRSRTRRRAVGPAINAAPVAAFETLAPLPQRPRAVDREGDQHPSTASVTLIHPARREAAPVYFGPLEIPDQRQDGPRHNPLDDLERRGGSVLEDVDSAHREAEIDAILGALNSTLWNRKRAAELLNVDYKALLYKMKKLGIVERASRVAI